MEEINLSSARAQQIINLLRDNPGVSMTLSDISDATGIRVAELAAHLEELNSHHIILHEQTPDGFDVYRFPSAYQRGSS